MRDEGLGVRGEGIDAFHVYVVSPLWGSDALHVWIGY
jgi:hypothetical protein